MKEYLIFSFFGIILFLETKIPLFPAKADRWSHATQNISLKLFNMMIIYIFFSLGKIFAFKQPLELDLFSALNLPLWLEILITLFVCDFFMYISHLLDHKIPFLWKIHTVHHSDNFVDSTTAFRTHIFELLIGNLMFLFFVFPIFGISFENYSIYQIIFVLVDIFHHSNISIPIKIDNLLKVLIVSPNMHRLHHSNIKYETDSNYGSVFSFWDKLFRTYRVKNPRDIVFGLDQFSAPKWQQFSNLLSMPFVVR